MIDGPDLEFLRRNSGIRLDGEGRWVHEGDVIRNQRLCQLFDESFRVDEAGEVRLELGDEWCFVKAEETAYFVRRARDDGDGGVILALNDGSDEPLDPATLMSLGDGALYCRVKGGRYPARLLRAAYHHVIHHLDVDESGRVLWAAATPPIALRQLQEAPGVA